MKFKLSIILVLLIAGTILPQGGSIYTRFGLGDLQYSYSARKLGMGELGISVADEDFVTSTNPAGWNRLTRTRIETGFLYFGNNIADNNSKNFYSNSKFSGFTIAFPASSIYGIGVAAGILPVTFVDYNVSQKVISNNSNINDYNINYQGEGGLSKIFIGSSYRLPFDLSIGATLEYYFGNLNYYSRINFPLGTGSNSEYDRRYQIRGVSSTIGLISPDFLPKTETGSFSDLRLGLSFNLGSNSSTDTMLISSSSLRRDTVSIAEVDLKIPFTLATGASVLLNKNYLITLDYLFQPWKDLAINNSVLPNLRNAMKVSAGIEYKPSRVMGATFWQQVLVRIGASYEQTQYKFGNSGIDRISFAGGVSLPFSTGNTLDLGLEYYMRGTKENNLFKENGIRLSLGISLGEVWFLREER